MAAETPEPQSVKIVVAGGFGTGKTTLVGSVSEIQPLKTEEILTEASLGVDDLKGVEAKRSTTVTLDFGRITINPRTPMSPTIVLYLFGTPGQERFWFMWDELSRGAVGAVVLVDTRRLHISFSAVDYFEQRQIPFIVAVNRFEGDQTAYPVEQIREALTLGPAVPIVMCDARDRASSLAALIELVRHALATASVATG
ncbi:GTP-binding protein [Fodinicola acaciae]|uniref:GTP-binding protein n=1 Tax=Fodinicola acaciae TaxID=2681555 RepID=UPI001C9E3CB2|nr:ATP/GTP-binding protein [Fodinicola acaciae]